MQFLHIIVVHCIVHSIDAVERESEIEITSCDLVLPLLFIRRPRLLVMHQIEMKEYK
jgi:hypothetical protein